MAEPDKLAGEGFAALFGRFNQSFLRRHEGLSFLMLESQDPVADARDFGTAGIAISAALQFEREGSRPDGSTLKVGFSLAFARDAAAPAIGFAACRQHHPENFWNPSLQQHPNGASAIAGAVIVAENPSDHHIFLSAFTAERELLATSSGITARTPRGDLAIMDPAAFRSHFGVPAPDITAGARLAALAITECAGNWDPAGIEAVAHLTCVGATRADRLPIGIETGHGGPKTDRDSSVLLDGQRARGIWS